MEVRGERAALSASHSEVPRGAPIHSVHAIAHEPETYGSPLCVRPEEKFYRLYDQ
jgi:hypothetical protein